MVDTCAIEIRDLTMEYPAQTSFFALGRSSGRVRAVDCISLDIAEGEIFGLVGPNGAGKTTLIKMLTTLLLPTSGWARVAGADVVRSAAVVRAKVGLVTSNERSFYWRLTGRQNLSFFADLYRLHAAESRLWIEELLELVGLKDRADDRFDGYSTGMRQRLALARGLLSKPAILFMDEPTKGVDPLGATEIIRLIQGRIVELWRPTILITSHNLSEIQRLCRRLALMHHGRLIACGALSELRELVRPADVYHLTVANLDARRVFDLAGSAGARSPVAPAGVNGTVVVEVTFPKGGQGFASLVRGVVEAGGDVLHCTVVEETIDDVFEKLVGATDRGRASAKPGAARPEDLG